MSSRIDDEGWQNDQTACGACRRRIVKRAYVFFPNSLLVVVGATAICLFVTVLAAITH
jgi:hypothetical protein